jgi:fatty-acyl-CoA synthase
MNMCDTTDALPCSGERILAGTLYISRLVACLADAGSRIMLRHENVDITANELLASIHRYARALMTFGIGRGSFVALFAPNCPDAIAIRYAANLIGSGVVYLSNPATLERRTELVTQMAPDLLVIFSAAVVLASAGSSVRIASVGVTVAAAAIRLDHLAREQDSGALPCPATPDDLAVVVCSGGTTGCPKEAVELLEPIQPWSMFRARPTGVSSSTGTWPICHKCWST